MVGIERGEPAVPRARGHWRVMLGRELGRPSHALAAAGVLLAWAALTLLLVGSHEAWRDEADPWLVARDRSPLEALQLAPYVGTPMLWHLSLMPLAKAGLPYGSMGAWCWLLGVGAMGVVLFLGPWPLPVSTVLAFSYLLSYEYPVIARSYQLGVALLLAAVACHRACTRRPVIEGLLLAAGANTNPHCLILVTAMAASCVAERWWSAKPTDRRPATGSILALAGVALAAAQIVVQPQAGQAVAAGVLWTPRWNALKQVLAQGWFPLREGWVWLGLALLVQLAVYAAVWSDRTARLFLVASQAGLIALFLLVYAGGVRHWGFLWLASLIALWLRAPRLSASLAERREARPWLAGVALAGTAAAASIPTAVWAWGRELSDDFSGSRATASFLLERGLGKYVVAGHPAEMAEAVLAYLDQPQIYYPARGEWGSHMWWDAKMLLGRSISDDELFARLDRAFGPARPLVLLATRRVSAAESHGYVLLYESPPSVVVDERFRVYGRYLANARARADRRRGMPDLRAAGLLANPG